jgi:hypothetical protein
MVLARGWNSKTAPFYECFLWPVTKQEIISWWLSYFLHHIESLISIDPVFSSKGISAWSINIRWVDILEHHATTCRISILYTTAPFYECFLWPVTKQEIISWWLSYFLHAYDILGESTLYNLVSQSRQKKILTLVLSKKNVWTKQKTITPSLQVKWSVPKHC